MGKTKRSQPFEFDEFVSQSRGSSSPYPTYPIEDIYPYEEGPPPEVILHPDVRSGEKAPPLAVSVKQSGPHPYRHRIRCYHLMACIVYFCCNCFLGALAFEYAGEHTGRTLKIFYYAKYNTIWYKWRYLPLVASGLLLDYRNLLNPSQWRHNECDGVSNHRHLACFLTVCSGVDQRKHQSSVSLAFVRSPVDSPHKGPVSWKCFHLMTSSWNLNWDMNTITSRETNVYSNSSMLYLKGWPFYLNLDLSQKTNL